MTNRMKKISETSPAARAVYTLFAVSAVFLGMMATGHAPSFAAKGDLVSFKTEKHVEAPLVITQGKADIIHLPEGVSDVLVANPTIVDVQAVQSNKLYAVGLNIGDTNLIVLDGSGNVIKRLDIHVSYDLQAIQSTVARLFPKESVKVGAIHDQIILTGSVSTPERAGKIADLVAHYVSDLQDLNGEVDFLISNLLEVRGEQQVMLQVKIVEAERSIVKELGVDLNANDIDELSAQPLFGGTPFRDVGNQFNSVGFGAAQGFTLTEDPIGFGRGFIDTGLDGVGVLGLFLAALEDENLVNVLAEPNLTAVSGQQAGFLAGGEFPVPAGRDQFGNIIIEYREFGVSLNFRPVVLSDDRISLHMNTEVSSLDDANGVVLAELTVPGLDIRRAETTIEVPSGGSLMIAGLLKSETAQRMRGLPGIKDTPVLGDLIASDGFNREETELVVIVTAYMVESYADTKNADKKPKNPRNSELSKIFMTNIRRGYDVDEDELFAHAERFGYIVD